MLHSVCSIGGPAIGTLAIAYLPISKVLYLDLIGALLAILSLVMVKIPNVVARQNRLHILLLQNFRKGFRLFQKQRFALSFSLCNGDNLCYNASCHYVSVAHNRAFCRRKMGIGIVEMVWGGGMLIGGVIPSIFKLKGSKVVAVNVMYVLLGHLFLSGVLPASWFVGFVMVTAIGGISLSVFNGCFTAIVQTEVISPEKLGRIFHFIIVWQFCQV